MNVKAVVQLTGVNENTLRSWERRYQALTPKRTQKGRRDYDQKDVERIEVLWGLVQEGHSISLIAGQTTDNLKQSLSEKYLRDRIRPTINESGKQKADDSIVGVCLDKMIQALERFQLQQLNQCLLKASFEIGPKDIVMKLILPLVKRVGLLILEKKMSIAQEHLLSALLRDYLGGLYQSLKPYDFISKLNSKSIILTTRQGDLHEFGILTSAILANLNGFKTYFLGPNMPVADLAQAVLHFKVDYLILGMMQLPKDGEIISSKNFINELDHQIPSKIKILWGGSEKLESLSLLSGRSLIKVDDLFKLDEFLKNDT
ncbi:MAG: MerR family transcriptional regulator [Bacteriovoracaceae bacterium]|nr:MerR family transcriptional regulator [Bacteriovoracaceae bacterium]